MGVAETVVSGEETRKGREGGGGEEEGVMVRRFGGREDPEPLDLDLEEDEEEDEADS